MKQKTAICIMGPTASGKSALAYAIAEQLSVEIISVDSAQIYRGMDIGTAKPSKEMQNKYPHHLIDICDPAEKYSAALFRCDALRLIDEIIAREKIPLFVGGTMLYYKALQQGLSHMPSADRAVREIIQEEAEKIGWAAMHAKLAKVDPVAAKKIHSNDSQRIQRALEVCRLTGKPISSYQGNAKEVDIHFINLVVGFFDRAILHKRIEQRFDAMLQEGFISEVETLFQRGDLNEEMPSIRSVGYRQAWRYLQGKITHDEMREQAIIATRQLAKRQLTWLKSWPQLTKVDGKSAEEIKRSLTTL